MEIHHGARLPLRSVRDRRAGGAVGVEGNGGDACGSNADAFDRNPGKAQVFG